MRIDDTLADPARARDALSEAVVAAGALALAKFHPGVRTWTKGSGGSPVTEADLAVDAFLRERLSLLAADYGWLSEETVDAPDRLSRRRVWIVDPIDGTRAFVDGGADWCVCAALVEAGRPIAAALFAPVTKELFVAATGAGTARNGAPLRASDRQTSVGASMAGPKSGQAPIARVLESAAEVRRIRSLALRIARVAEGAIDAAFAGAGGHDWDLAAADLLVHEAGGRLTGLDGTGLAFNRPRPVHGPLVAAGGRLHERLLAELSGAVRSRN